MNTISEIVTASYSTSKDAETVSKNLKKWLGCEANYEVARLALGRSLSIDDEPEQAPDGKGLPLKGIQLFGTESDGNYLWIALLSEQLRKNGHKEFSLEALQQLVRNHWHRGAFLLETEWLEAESNEAKFVELLSRRAGLPENLSSEDSYLNDSDIEIIKNSASEQECSTLIKKIKDFGVTSEIRDSIIGPRIIQYRLYLSNANDYLVFERNISSLEFSLGVEGIHIYQANEPQTCFLEIPKNDSEHTPITITQFDQAANEFCSSSKLLPISPGVDVVGRPVIFDLAEAPHILIGGTTGSGKSVCVNSLLLSLLLASRTRPIKFALIDPKEVEFSLWKDSELLYSEIATSLSSAISLLDVLVDEMNKRYAKFSELGVKDLAEARERGFQGGWIVLAVDELADLVMQGKSGKNAEDKLVQLAQKARSAGIHLILATQRPDAKTFSGLLRSNCPARIALKVQNAMASTIILDETGADKLLGKGDMLVKGFGPIKKRIHGYYIQTKEIEKHLSNNGFI